MLEIFGTIEGTRPGQKIEHRSLRRQAPNPRSTGAVELDDKTGTMFAEASDVEIAPLLAVLKSQDR